MSSGAGNNRDKLLSLPTRSYLDETVVPVMMQALAAVARDRPEDPIDYVAHFLLKNNPKRISDASRGFSAPSS
jgi:protein dpy-30